MHEDYGDKGDGKVEFALSLLVLSASKDLQHYRMYMYSSLKYLIMKYLSALTYFKKYMHVHISQSDEWKNPRCQSGVPQKGKGVPKDISRVFPEGYRAPAVFFSVT